jgi:hypothetical protein
MGRGEIRNKLFAQRRPPHHDDSPGAAGKRVEAGDDRPRRELIKGPDLETALQSVQYAHYTSEGIVRGIWDAMRHIGFEGGRILEPGMGAGHFFTAAPADVVAERRATPASSWTPSPPGSEAAAAAGERHRRRFHQARSPMDSSTLPLATRRSPSTKVLNDPAYKKYRFSLHDYFFAKSIDKVRPGGLLTFITSRYTMDKLDTKARDYIAERADFLGAIRLPQSAFKENAGTEVVTDVLFFQRRMPGADKAGEAWQATNQVKVGGRRKRSTSISPLTRRWCSASMCSRAACTTTTS